MIKIFTWIKIKLLRDLAQALGKDKSAFISKVQNNIYDKINNCSIKECLSVVEISSYLEKIWEPSDALDGYIPRFIAFLRKKKYNNHILDSYLTDKVVDEVVSTYSNFVKEHSSFIIKPLITNILNDKKIVDSIANEAVKTWQGTLPSVLRSKLATILAHKIEASISTDIIHASSDAIATAASKIVAASASIPITKSIAILLAKHTAIMLKGVVTKVLASAAFKTMLATSVKKFVAAKILTMILASLGSKLAGISISWILAPLIIAFVAYEVNTLPEKLAKNISTAIANELDEKYGSINKQIASNLVTTIGGPIITAFINDMIHDDSMKDLINELKKSI